MSIFLRLFVFVLFVFAGCGKSDSGHGRRSALPEGSKFEYNKLGNMVVQSTVNDTIACGLVFDTGGGGELIFDRKFAAKNFLEDKGVSINLKSGWNFFRDIPCERIDKSVVISIGGGKVVYDHYLVTDIRYLNLVGAEGLISPPRNDSRTWELNFAYKYIALHRWLNTFVAERSILFSLDTQNAHYIIKQFPLLFPTGKVYENLLLDTGSPETMIYQFALPDSAMLLAMNDKTAQQYTSASGGDVQIIRYRLQEQGLLGRKIWIERRKLLRPWRITGEQDMVIVGLDFLKSFNIYITPSSHHIAITRIHYTPFQEELGHSFRMFEDANGNAVVDYIRKESFYGQIGLLDGDVILRVDGQRLFDLPRNYFDKIPVGANVSFDVIRDGDTLEIHRKYHKQ
jgi:hypothetical protein